MQATDTKQIEIGQFIQELWRFEDKWSKLEWEMEWEGNGMGLNGIEWHENLMELELE